jgi:hypothetical protein
MNIKELVSHIAEQEGKKHEASVGDVREIVGILSDLFYSEDEFDNSLYSELYKNGKRRANKKGKK